MPNCIHNEIQVEKMCGVVQLGTARKVVE